MHGIRLWEGKEKGRGERWRGNGRKVEGEWEIERDGEKEGRSIEVKEKGREKGRKERRERNKGTSN